MSQSGHSDRDEALLAALNAACADYTEDEVLKALGRKLLAASHDPLLGPRTTLADIQVLTQGHQQMFYYRQTGLCRRHALILAAGVVSGVVAQWQDRFPGLRVW